MQTGESQKAKLESLSRLVVLGEVRKAKVYCQTLARQGLSGHVIIREGLIRGMQLVGELYREQKISVPEILIAAKTIDACIEILVDDLPDGSGPSKQITVVLGTAKGDIHSIGKDVVAMILSKSGYHVIDLGTNVAKERFLEAVIQYGAEVVDISAMLTTILGNVVETIHLLRQHYSEQDLCIIVGGVAVTKRFAKMHAVDYADDPFVGMEIIEAFHTRKLS